MPALPLAIDRYSDQTEHPCPIGEGTVKVYSKIAANTHGGFDSIWPPCFQRPVSGICHFHFSQSLLSLFGRDMLATWSTEELAAASLP